jgi:TrmH family RNA methyltransferase
MITSRQNQKVKDIRRLRRCKGDQALLEGPHLVEEALAAGLPISQVLVSPDFLATTEGRSLPARLAVPPLEVEAQVLRSLCEADSPQGILAVAELPRRGASLLPLVPEGIYVFAEGLQDPGNLGAIARVAEAAGAAGLALTSGTVHPNHPRALRASAGSLLRLPVAVDADTSQLDRQLEALAPRWIALVPRGGASLYGSEIGAPVVLAVGGEGQGLSPTVLARADLGVTIPLAAPVESLNVAVAAALALFEIRRRRHRPI